MRPHAGHAISSSVPMRCSAHSSMTVSSAEWSCAPRPRARSVRSICWARLVAGSATPKASPRLERDVQVLVVQVHPEAGREVVLQEVAPAQLHDAVRRQAAAEHVENPFRVHAGLGAEHQRLGHGLDGQRDHDLVARLHGLPGARSAHVHDRPTHRLEDRACALEVVLVAADHDRQRSLARTHVAPAHGRVEAGHATRGELDRHGRMDRGHVDPQPWRRRDDVVGHGEHGRGVRQHRDHDVGVRGLPQRRRSRSARHRLRRAVEDRHVKARAHEVRGHRLTHDAQPDEADHRVTSQSSVSTVARVGLYSSPTQPV